MRTLRTLAALTTVAATLLVDFSKVEAQVPNPPPMDSVGALVNVVPGPLYGAGPLKRALFGSGWREVWLTGARVPLLDIGSYAGGLEIDKRGGGFQTITLHMTETDGWREYRFRSVNKFPMLRLPESIQGTLVGRIIQDQTSSLFPAAALVVPPFVQAVGGLHVVPKMYLMPDDPRLGVHQPAFAGLLGTMELKGEEAPDDKPGFAGSSKIKGTDKFMEDIREDRGHRLDEREMLAVRLVDFLINDGDRTPDNYDWARFGEKGNYLWRPISRDRDRAFTNARGILNELVVRRFYPKFTKFGDRISLKGNMVSSYIFDRRLLQRLTADDFSQVARGVQLAITDSVIEAGISALPIEWREQTDVSERLRSTLKARRAVLQDVAMQFYAKLASETDIRLTGDDEKAVITRHSDGRVTVSVPGIASVRPIVIAATPDSPSPGGGATRTMNGMLEATGGAPAPYFHRTFLPSETRELRVYLGKGNDTVVVRGASNNEIIVRLIGEEGADVLADSAGGRATHLYDSDGRNRFVTTGGTHVSEKSWDSPDPIFGFSPGNAWKPDWGHSRGWQPVIKHMQGSGLVLGAGPRFKGYGFRRLPHWYEAKTAFLYGTGSGRVGLTADVDYRTENSPLAFTVAAKASQLDGFRFYGYGNETPEIDRNLSLVQQNIVSIEPAAVWQIGWRAREERGDILNEDSTSSDLGMRALVGRVSFGPRVAWSDPDPLIGSPLLAPGMLGGTSFGHVGFRSGLELDQTDRSGVPTRGYNVRAELTGYPQLLDLGGAFGTASASGATYLPIGTRGFNVALRAGGAVASGDVPAQYAPSIGGSSSLRGYSSRRFAGDAAASGSVEVRAPVGTLNFLVKSQVGVFGLADAGRVWYDGRSDGSWHTGVGGGVWLSAFGRVVSFTYAKGDSDRFYVKGGLAF